MTDEPALIDTRSELIAALGTLPPRQRAVLVLRYFVDLPETDVAAILGCSLGTVKSTASRALARLEQRLSPAEPNETRSGVSIVGLGTSAPNAFAGWKPTPTHASLAQMAKAQMACDAQLSGHPDGALRPVLDDTRGPFTVVIFAGTNEMSSCITGPGFTAISGSTGPGVTTVPAGRVELTSTHFTTRDGDPYTIVQGHAGKGVSSATLNLDDGTTVKATTANGWFTAWWPGSHDATAAVVATPTGTITQRFSTHGPINCAGPGPCARPGVGATSSESQGGPVSGRSQGSESFSTMP